MTPDEEKKIITAWSDNALRLMKEQSVAPLPENYTLWFEYTRGGNKKLKDAINGMIKEHKPFTHESCRQLYHNFIVKDIDSKSIVEASNKVQSIMQNVLKAVEASSEDTASYNTELETFTSELQGEGLPGDDNAPLRAVISKIVDKTKELKEKGESLNKKLAESREEVEALRNNLEEVSLQVSLDGLTGIANRKAFDSELLRHMREAKETGQNLCLIFIDVDHFKKFNDTYGHLLGDQVLRIVAQSTKDMVKGKDFVARFGGEEFAVILPDTPLRGGEIVAENIRKTIANRELKRKDTGESYGTMTVSMGVTMFKPRYDSAEDFISRADKALYLSKKNGRNMVTTEE